MMSSIFLSPAAIQSSRWRLAFPHANYFVHENDLPANLENKLVWVLLAGEQYYSLIVRLIENGAKVIVLTEREDSRQAKK